MSNSWEIIDDKTIGKMLPNVNVGLTVIHEAPKLYLWTASRVNGEVLDHGGSSTVDDAKESAERSVDPHAHYHENGSVLLYVNNQWIRYEELEYVATDMEKKDNRIADMEAEETKLRGAVETMARAGVLMDKNLSKMEDILAERDAALRTIKNVCDHATGVDGVAQVLAITISDYARKALGGSDD